jgi:hypothetical protein
MSQSWPARFLDYLEIVDTQEAPHGLYGMLRAYAPEGRLPTLAEVLAAPGKIDLLKKCGFSNPSAHRRYRSPFSDRRKEVLGFSVGAERVSLDILNYATTKVRHYGSAFRLDKRHLKQPKEPGWDLESLVPKLGRSRGETDAILLIAHYASMRELEGVLGKTVEHPFLDRYGLAHYARDRDDPYERGFRTSLQLWVPRIDGADPAGGLPQ